jgi:hypothetical protein
VSEVCFQFFVEVMGFTHVFENGWKCNSLWMSVFFVFVIFVSKVSAKQIRSVYPGKGFETVIHWLIFIIKNNYINHFVLK